MSYAPFTKNGLWLSACIAKVIGYIQSPGLLNAKKAFEGLEPCDGKLSRTVLRGKGGRKAPDLPGSLLLIIGTTTSGKRLLIKANIWHQDKIRLFI